MLVLSAIIVADSIRRWYGLLNGRAARTVLPRCQRREREPLVLGAVDLSRWLGA